MRLSVDDFGTGWSSLSYLQILSVQEAEIDRSAITDLPERPGNVAIVRAILDLGGTPDSRWWPRASRTQAT